MIKKFIALMLTLCLMLAAIPAMGVVADEPELSYFTVKFDGFDSVSLKPVPTGEKPYSGQVHVFDYSMDDKVYGLFVDYNDFYGDVADRVFYDEDSNSLIIGVTSSAELKKFCVELHPGSTGTIDDEVTVAVNATRYSFDENGRVYFKKVPKDMILNVRLSPSKPEKSSIKTNKSNTYTGSCTVKVKNYYKRVVLSGDDAGIAKINKSLKKMSTAFLKNKDIHTYAKEQVKYGTYDDSYEDYGVQSVTYMNDEVVSICALRQWYAGGVSNIFYDGYTYDLRTGKLLNKITDFTKESSLKKLRKTIAKKMVKQGELEELAEPEINKMKATDFNFCINKKGNVEVYFGPYTLSHGGWTTECVVDGKYNN